MTNTNLFKGEEKLPPFLANAVKNGNIQQLKYTEKSINNAIKTLDLSGTFTYKAIENYKSLQMELLQVKSAIERLKWKTFKKVERVLH